MSNLFKYRVNDVAKDFNLPPKDVVDILAKYATAPKTNQKVLDESELNIIFDAITKEHSVDDLGKAMTLAVKSEIEIKEEKAVAAAQPAQPTQPRPAQPAQPSQPTQPTQPMQPRPAQSMQPRPAQPMQPRPAQPMQPRPAQPTQSRPAQPAQPSRVEKFQQRVAQPAQPKPTQTKPTQPRPQSQQPQRQVIHPAASTQQGSVTMHTEVPQSKQQQVRYVDTRGAGSSADLSKYDERIDALVPEHAKQGGSGIEKIKRAPDRKATTFSQKRRQEEAEKMRRLQQQTIAKKVPLKVLIPDEIAVAELAMRLKKTGADVVKKLVKLGIMASVSQIIDFDTASLVALEFDAKVEKEIHLTIEERLIDAREDSAEDLVPRDPIVVVMGHVDHGKTSLLDRIRKANVVSGEAGGITQHIGAYRVDINGNDITFLDTPGHAAFTSMRARGAMITDIAILVVAADDGIMPQTIEAINHAKAANVPIIVAINKMDKPTANPERIMQQLTEYELVSEEWGGDTIICKVSAATGEGIDNLLEMISLTAEMRELRANPNRSASGSVIEAKLDKSRGPVATVLVQNGTLHTGDTIIAGKGVGRIRAMTNDKGEKVEEAGPSIPVEVIGLSEVPGAGDQFHIVEDERMARELVEERKQQEKDAISSPMTSKVSLTDLFAQMQEGELKELNLIIKGDVQGSVEAVRASLEKLSNEEVRVHVIHGGVGAINESDIMLADASNAIVIGFNVRPDAMARESAEHKKIDMRLYRVIYDCIEEMQAAMKGMLAPTFRENVLGHAEVRQTFKVSGIGTIAGCMVQQGLIRRSAQIRIVRNGIVVHEGELTSLKRFKDDAKEVAAGYECGISIEKFNDIKENDIIEAFVMEEIEK